MKSSIKIALGANNEPVINMVVVQTDDIRDQLCQQFKERLGYDSNLAFVEFVSLPGEKISRSGSSQLSIQPISLPSHYLCHQRVEEIYKCLQQQYPEVCMTVGGGTIGFYANEGKGPGVELNREDLVNMNIVDLFKEITESIKGIIKPETLSVEMDNSLPSTYQIEDSVSTEGIYDAEVTAVRFTR